MTTPSALEDPTAAPDLLLVHGAWHGPWAWDLLIPHLPGVVRTVALPSSGAEPSALGGHAEDVDAIRTALAESADRPTVVVAHSGSGLSTTRAVCGQQHVVVADLGVDGVLAAPLGRAVAVAAPAAVAEPPPAAAAAVAVVVPVVVLVGLVVFVGIVWIVVEVVVQFVFERREVHCRTVLTRQARWQA